MLHIDMIIVLEFLAFLIEPLLLLFGGILSYLLGKEIYTTVNGFLYSINTPCLEVISFLIAVVSPVAFYYGVYHKTFLFRRSTKHHLTVFLLSYAFGTLVTFLPIGSTMSYATGQLYCPQQLTLNAKIAQSIATGLITSFLAFLNLDLGVVYAYTVRSRLIKNKKKK